MNDVAVRQIVGDDGSRIAAPLPERRFHQTIRRKWQEVGEFLFGGWRKSAKNETRTPAKREWNQEHMRNS